MMHTETPSPTITVIYSVALGLAFLAALAVPITYAVRSHGEWRRHADGRHLMTSDGLLAGMLLYYFACSLVDWPNAERLGAAALMLFFAYVRVDRVKFMRRWTQSTGYDDDDASHGPNRKEMPREQGDDIRA